ncbi:MAG TPA: hypothetical protein VFP00_00495 [Burkholderiales bacterium]|nr:hypothetical protein [Burkholderiales bacterium]
MKTGIERMALISASTLLLAGLVQAQPVLNPNNDHFYEVVPGNGISWNDASLAAEASFHLGVQGHLATITSAAENQFVDQLRQDALDAADISQAQVWIGGFQAAGSGEPGEGWQWVNGEGTFPGVDSATPFADWAAAEPNNVGGSESHLTLGRYGLGGGWNDEGSAQSTIGGYVIEYDNTAAAQNCLEGNDGVSEATGGCNPSGVQLLQLPQNSQLQEGYTITQFLVKPDPTKKSQTALVQAGHCVDEFLFPDIRVGANGRPNGPMVPLDVFDALGGGPAGALILDAQTYGSPCFAVVKGGANFELVQALPQGGVATSTQYPDLVPGIGAAAWDCYDPVDNPDLQLGTQFTYQTDNLALMAERSAAAMTNHCNSPSRGATFKFSFFVLNTHEDCGIDRSLPGGPQAVLQCFKGFAVAKFDALDMALAGSADNLVSPKLSTLTSKLNQARSMINTGQYDKARTRLNDLLALVRGATWNADTDNDPGNLEMRILNLLYRNEQLIEASAAP